jgi:hypothetical protein
MSAATILWLMKDGAVNDEVIRGLRWGAILVAALALGVAGYRIAREVPPAQAAPRPDPAAVASNPTGEAPAKAPALPPTTPVPAPPPIRKVARNIARPAVPPPSPIAMPVVEARVVDEPGPAIAPPAQEPAVIAPQTPAPVVASAKEPEPVQDSRGRRWLKAVGHWVHVIVKN